MSIVAPTPDEASRRRAIFLGLAVMASLLVRALHFGAIHRAAFIEFPLLARDSDLWGFWAWSGEILGGNLWGDPPWHPYFHWMAQWADREEWSRWWGGALTFQQEPAYPYLLAGLRALGAGLSTIVLLQLLVTALTPIPVYFLTRRFASDRGALLAAVLAGLYAPLVFYSGALLRDWFSALLEPSLVLLALIASERARERAWAWCSVGAAMGFALLIKYTALLLIAGLAVWAVVQAASVRCRVQRASALALGVVLGMSPLIARNAVVGAPLFKVCNRPIESFVMANVADVQPIGMQMSPHDAREVLRTADGNMGRAMIETLGTFHGDVQLFAQRQWERIRSLLDPFEVPNNLSFDYGRRLSPILSYLPAWGVVAPLGLAGFLLALTAWRRHSLLLVYAAGVTIPLLVQFVIDRYRLPLAVTMCVAAGLLASELGALWQQRKYRAVAAWVSLALGIFTLQHTVLPLESVRGNVMALHPSSYGLAVRAYALRGNPAAARDEIASFRQLAATHPALQHDIDALALRMENELRDLDAARAARGEPAETPTH